MSKAARLEQARKEQADLEVEVKQLMIQNGELAHSIKTENDATRTMSEQDAVIAEFISDLESELKIVQDCIEEQDDCLNVCNMVQSYQNEEKETLKDTFKGQTTTFTDQVNYYEKELEDLNKQLDLLQNNKLRESSEFESACRELKEKVNKATLEEKHFHLQNEKGGIVITELQKDLFEMNERLTFKADQVACVQKDFERLAENEANISLSNKELSKQLQSKRQENYSLEEKCSKIGCETESLTREIERLTIKTNNLQLDVENHKGVIEELEELQEQINEGSKKVNEHRYELEKLKDIELQNIQADRERSKLSDKLDLMNKELQITDGKNKEIENIELHKERITEEIARMIEQLDTEETKRNQLIADLQMKVQAVEEIKKQVDEEKLKLLMTKETIQQRESLLRGDIAPKLAELKELQGQVEEQEKLLVSKEAEKKEKQLSVRHITNEFHLQMKENLDLLKIRLDSKLAEANDISSMLSNLENEATEKEQHYSKELERITQDEKEKIDQAVKPILQEHEATQLKEMQSKWQKFKSPLPSKRISFAKQGFNLETSSPFDITLDSQEKTNRLPKQVITPRKKVNSDSNKTGLPINQKPNKTGDSSRSHSNLDEAKHASAKTGRQVIVCNNGLSNRSQVTGSYIDKNQKPTTVTSHDLAHEKQAAANKGIASGIRTNKFLSNKMSQSSQEI